MACANIVPEILRLRTHKNIKGPLTQKKTTPKYNQKISTLCDPFAQ